MIGAMLWALWSAVLYASPYLMSGAMVAAMVALLARSDLIANAIAKGLAPVRRADGPSAEWTADAGSLIDGNVAPVVWVQMLANRVMASEADRLRPLAKRLEAAGVRLSDAMRMRRRAWTAFRFERLQVIEAWSKFNNLPKSTQSVATNTDHRVVDATIPTKQTVPPPPDEAKRPEELTTRPSVSDGLRPDDEIAGHPEPLEPTVGESRNPSDDVVGDRGSDSLVLTVLELAGNAMSAAMWLIDALSSRAHWRRVFKVSRALYAIFRSENSRIVARHIYDIAEKTFKITTDVNTALGTTVVTVQILPGAENWITVSYF